MVLKILVYADIVDIILRVYEGETNGRIHVYGNVRVLL
jgi:hypothetical protein